MVRELIFFTLRLGPDTDAFVDRFEQVQRRMAEMRVVVGRTWYPATGEGRQLVVEREFTSLAAYEQDDERFHGGAEFMSLWREMEALAVQMRVEIWQGGTEYAVVEQ
jgi:hypothetical protein